MNALVGMDRFLKDVIQLSTYKELFKGSVMAPLHVLHYVFRSFLDMEQNSFILIIKLNFFLHFKFRAILVWVFPSV